MCFSEPLPNNSIYHDKTAKTLQENWRRKCCQKCQHSQRKLHIWSTCTDITQIQLTRGWPDKPIPDKKLFFLTDIIFIVVSMLLISIFRHHDEGWEVTYPPCINSWSKYWWSFLRESDSSTRPQSKLMCWETSWWSSGRHNFLVVLYFKIRLSIWI